MKANILSLSLALVVLAVMMMDFQTPDFASNIASYSLFGLSALMFGGLYLASTRTEADMEAE